MYKTSIINQFADMRKIDSNWDTSGSKGKYGDPMALELSLE